MESLLQFSLGYTESKYCQIERKKFTPNAPYFFVVWSNSIDNGGWTLVRRVKKGTIWHPATDSLAGTDEYGTPGHETSDETFSILFNDTLFNQFLFATGKSQ